MGSTSAVLNLTVYTTGSALTVSSAANPSVEGTSVTFTATLGGSPTGAVTFLDDGITLGTGTFASGVATFTTASLSAWDDDITALYTDDTNFSLSTSNTLTQAVQQTTDTTVVSSVGLPIYRQSITFTAFVNGSADDVLGPVTFLDGSSTLGTGALNDMSTATFSTATLAQGNHTITAVYGGDSSSVGSTSAVLNLTVYTTGSALTVSSATNPSVEGAAVTFTATLGGSPTGAVTFLDDGITLGTGTFASGTATFTTANLDPGNRSITALYTDDTTFSLSTSNTLTQAVQQTTDTTVVSSVSLPILRQNIIFTAFVDGGTYDALGPVTFLDGSSPLGTGTLDDMSTATFNTATLAQGNHTITAVYGGDSSSVGSTSAVLNLTVYQTGSALTVSSATNPTVEGTAVTFTATLGGSPTSAVTFLDDGATLGTATFASNTATFTTTGLSAADHDITAIYTDNSTYTLSTSNTVTQTVEQRTITTVVSSDSLPIFGQMVSLTAMVLGSTDDVTGGVTFLDGTTVLGTDRLDDQGWATLNTAILALGSHTITAVYSGDSGSVGNTSAVLDLTVCNPGVPLTVTASSNPVVQSTSVTFTVTASGSPTGTVTFLDGGTSLGTGAFASGVATFSSSSLTSGEHDITAVYTDSSYNLSTSNTVTQTIQQTTTTTVTSSDNWPTVGETVTFTTTVVGQDSDLVTTGTVTFQDGSTSLGTAMLDDGGLATFDTSTLGFGSHTITAVYSGDSDSVGSTSAVLNLTVDNAGTALSVTSSSNPSIAGSAVTFTVTLSGSPTGTVTFLDAGTSLGTGVFTTGTATFSTTTLSGGDHTITAVYTDAANSAVSASNTLTQRVQQTTVTTTLSSLNPGIAGQSITFTATVVGAIDVVTGTVTFQDASIILGTGTVDDLGMMTFNTSSLTSGNHTITAIYSGDGSNAGTTSAALSVTVYQTGPVLNLITAQNPSAPGSAVTFTATVNTSPSPTGTVTFLDGGTSLGTGTFNGSGVATYSTSSLSGGDHEITAIYTDGTSVTASVSNPLTQRVQQTTSPLGNALNSSDWGDGSLGNEELHDGKTEFVGFMSGDDGDAADSADITARIARAEAKIARAKASVAWFERRLASLGDKDPFAAYLANSEIMRAKLEEAQAQLELFQAHSDALKELLAKAPRDRNNRGNALPIVPEAIPTRDISRLTQAQKDAVTRGAPYDLRKDEEFLDPSSDVGYAIRLYLNQPGVADRLNREIRSLLGDKLKTRQEIVDFIRADQLREAAKTNPETAAALKKIEDLRKQERELEAERQRRLAENKILKAEELKQLRDLEELKKQQAEAYKKFQQRIAQLTPEAQEEQRQVMLAEVRRLREEIEKMSPEDLVRLACEGNETEYRIALDRLQQLFEEEERRKNIDKIKSELAQRQSLLDIRDKLARTMRQLKIEAMTPNERRLECIRRSDKYLLPVVGERLKQAFWSREDRELFVYSLLVSYALGEFALAIIIPLVTADVGFNLGDAIAALDQAGKANTDQQLEDSALLLAKARVGLGEDALIIAASVAGAEKTPEGPSGGAPAVRAPKPVEIPRAPKVEPGPRPEPPPGPKPEPPPIRQPEPPPNASKGGLSNKVETLLDLAKTDPRGGRVYTAEEIARLEMQIGKMGEGKIAVVRNPGLLKEQQAYAVFISPESLQKIQQTNPEWITKHGLADYVKSNRGVMVVGDEVTYNDAIHEVFHLEDWKQNPTKYAGLSKLQKERQVFEKILQPQVWDSLTALEQESEIRYFTQVVMEAPGVRATEKQQILDTLIAAAKSRMKSK